MSDDTMRHEFEILSASCIRCASCATVAGDTFVVDKGPARVVVQPRDDAALRRAEAARLLCPTGAILRREVRDGP